MVSLYDNTPNSTWASIGWAATTRAGRFQASVAGYAVGFRWYRPASGTTDTPIGLHIWNTSGTALWSKTTGIVDSLAAGWQVTPIDPPLGLAAFTTYVVGVDIANSKNFPRSTEAGRVAAPSPLLFDDIGEWYCATGIGYPSSAQDGYMVAADLVWSLTSGVTPGPGEGEPTTTGDLQSWLSSEAAVQTHEADGLPWLTKVVADATKNAVDAGRIVIDATKDIVELIPKRTDSEWAAVLKLWQIAGILTEAEIDLWNLFAKRAPGQLTGPTPGGGSAFFSDDGRQVAQTAADVSDQVSSLSGQVEELTGLVLQLQAPLAGFPTDFELASEFEFVDCVSWPVAADVYVLHMTTLPRGKALSPVCGVNVCMRSGWWAPLADTLPGERRYLDFEFNLLSHAGGRIPGVLVELGQNGAATIQAWNRLPPPIGPLPVPPIP